MIEILLLSANTAAWLCPALRQERAFAMKTLQGSHPFGQPLVKSLIVRFLASQGEGKEILAKKGYSLLNWVN
jgi:hypothetical protein